MTDLWLAAGIAVAVAGMFAAAAVARRRRRYRRLSALLDGMPHLCMRCGRSLPIVEANTGADGSLRLVVTKPLGVVCVETGIAGLLCGRACADAWVTHHMATHHRGQEIHP